MNMKGMGLVISISLLVNACATGPKSALLGAAIGGAAGGVIGQSQAQNSQGTAVGALVGAGVGSLIGYLAYSDKKKKENASKPAAEEGLVPFLTKPRIRSYIGG